MVYFSRTGEQYTVGVIDKGNTAIVAEMISEETGADMFEMIPEDNHYPMTYSELTDVAKQEQNDNGRPAYEGSGLSGFDKKLSSACPDATVLDGLAIRGNNCQNDQDSVRESINAWISGLGYF